MSQTTLNVRIDEDVKKAFEKFCSEVGLNVSVAINMFAKTVIREQRLPFEVKTGIPNAETIKAIEEVQRMKADSSIGKTFTNVDEMMKELLA